MLSSLDVQNKKDRTHGGDGPFDLRISQSETIYCTTNPATREITPMAQQ